MKAPVSDFRSDTVTQPTPAMRTAMAEAVVGDDVLDGDPSTRALESQAAEWLGKEGALFVPSGTMANQIAIGSWTRPGDEAICERTAHVVQFEAGAMGAIHGVQPRLLDSVRGALDPDQVRAAIQPDFIHCPRTGLLCLEQTHMSSGGRVVPLENMREVAEIAHAAGVSVHIDGARLGNAVVASGIEASAWAGLADSVSDCLSKGLGAPVGSIVAGDGAFLERARVLRKRLGGWMRQCGHMAAAASLALSEGLARLSADHALAQDLAAGLDSIDGLSSPPADVETNLILVGVDHPEFDAPALSERLGTEGILVYSLTPESLRFVTHRDVGGSDVERLVLTLQKLLG